MAHQVERDDKKIYVTAVMQHVRVINVVGVFFARGNLLLWETGANKVKAGRAYRACFRINLHLKRGVCVWGGGVRNKAGIPAVTTGTQS